MRVKTLCFDIFIMTNTSLFMEIANFEPLLFSVADIAKWPWGGHLSTVFGVNIINHL